MQRCDFASPCAKWSAGSAITRSPEYVIKSKNTSCPNQCQYLHVSSAAWIFTGCSIGSVPFYVNHSRANNTLSSQVIDRLTTWLTVLHSLNEFVFLEQFVNLSRLARNGATVSWSVIGSLVFEVCVENFDFDIQIKWYSCCFCSTIFVVYFIKEI